MSTATRVPRARAEPIARQLLEAIGRGCRRAEIAGSIRRGRPDVGDIEIVAVPRYRRAADGLFDSREVDELQEAIDELIGGGMLAPHPGDPKRGPRYSKLTHPGSGLQVDLFSARPETFGLILLIRTGPAEYSQRFVTDIKGLGYHVAGGELHRGGTFGCPRLCEFVATPDEGDVYQAIGHPWIDPAARDGLARLGR